MRSEPRAESFRPGPGVLPPYLAGREREQDRVEVRVLDVSRPPPSGPGREPADGPVGRRPVSGSLRSATIRDGRRIGRVGRLARGRRRRAKETGKFLKTRCYTLRVEGLGARDGEIPDTALTEVVGAMRRLAERVTRLRATGISTARGARPKWLEETLTFTITGLSSGSTTIGYRAPCLEETARDQFGRPFLAEERELPNLHDTALDLVSEAVPSVIAEEGSGAKDYLDQGVVKAMLDFGRAAGSADVGYTLRPEGTEGRGFVWDRGATVRAERRLETLPPARAFIVTGRLDRIEHDGGRFRLRLKDGSVLAGQLDTATVDREVLRPLWGRDSTVTGQVHFRADGRPRAIVARHLMPRADRHEMFERTPQGAAPGTAKLPAEFVERAKNFDLDTLKGAWPGDETIEELMEDLAALRSVR